MPEGDTVWRSARHLHEALAGRALIRSDFRVPQFAAVDLTGHVVDEVVSRGKHILIRVGDTSIHSHLKMEGSWRLYRPGTPWRRPAFQARAVLENDEWQAVGFELGVLEVLPRERESDAVGHLGPDLLGAWDARTAGVAVANLRAHPHDSIAGALLDQRNLAGIGNEYANELLFLRGYLPTRAVADIDDSGLEATVALARRMLLANRDRVDRTSTGRVSPGSGVTHGTDRGSAYVYRRAGRPCRRCGTAIEEGVLGAPDLQQPVLQQTDPQQRHPQQRHVHQRGLQQRRTFWCPSCQR